MLCVVIMMPHDFSLVNTSEIHPSEPLSMAASLSQMLLTLAFVVVSRLLKVIPGHAPFTLPSLKLKLDHALLSLNPLMAPLMCM